MVFSDSLDEYEDDEESSGGVPLFSGLVSTMSGMASGGVPLSSELFSQQCSEWLVVECRSPWGCLLDCPFGPWKLCHRRRGRARAFCGTRALAH